MRTTVRIDEELLKEAKQLAIRRGKSLTSIIEDALRESITRQNKYGQREPVRLVTFNGHGTLPGIDLDDSATLLDLLDSTNDSD